MSKYKYKSEAVCPWCDYEHSETYEWFSGYDGDGSSTKVECHNCSKEFEITQHVSVEYSTSIDCPGHELDLSEYEGCLESEEYLIKKKDLNLVCNVCKEDFYTWSLPDGRYPKMKDGMFKFVGRAVEIMKKRGELNGKQKESVNPEV